MIGTNYSRVVGVCLAVAVLGTACGGASEPTASEPANSAAPSTGDTEPEIFAGVDISRSEVPLDEIVFDTFDGGSVRFSDATESQIEALIDAIPPIDDPTYETNPTWLNDDDLVVTMVDSTGQAWAWPHRILNFHEIVNDEIDGVPLLVSYCPLCRSGVIYDRRVDIDGERTLLTFGNTSALYENDLVMVDRETSTYWWQVRGRAILGTLTGTDLTVLPSSTTRWPTWFAAHPDTLVLTRESGGRLYENDPFSSYAEFVETGRYPFPVSEEAANDDRLPSSTLVIVITVDDATFAIATTGERRDLTVAGVTVTIDGEGGAEANLDGQPFPSRSAFWFAAVSSFPDIEIAG